MRIIWSNSAGIFKVGMAKARAAASAGRASRELAARERVSGGTEGDRILRVLKSECSLNGIVNDVKRYLSPVLSRDGHDLTRNIKRQSPEEKFGKYELFSLKLLKQCIELWKSGCHGDTATLLQLGLVSVDSLVVCSSSSGKAPPLSFEKLLFHFASQCVASSSYEAGMLACRVLCQRVEGGAVQSVPKLMKEGQSLLKHSYDLIWKAAIKVEQNATNSDSPDVTAVGLSLELRKTALLCLLSADFDLCFLLERVVRSDLRYQKVCAVCHGNSSSCNYFERLYAFHAALLESRDLSALIDHKAPCRTLSSGVEYLLALAKVCEGSGRRKKGNGYVAKAQSLCRLHAEICREKLHLVGTVRTQVAALIRLLTETDVCTSPEHLRLLEGVASGLESVVESRALDSTSLPRVVASLEGLVSMLESRREEFRGKMAGEREGDPSYCSKQVFLSLQRILTLSVSCVEQQLCVPSLPAASGKPATGSGADASLERSIRSRQLSMLGVLVHLLLDLLLAADDADGYDEIEIARSSAASRPIVAEQSSAHHPKKDLADLCLPVLSSSQRVLMRASPGLLSAVEHKYLGNAAYNCGLALHRCELYREASSVLELACRELGAWCAGEEMAEEMSQVLKKFLLLFDCLRQSRQFPQLLASVESATTLLPANQIATPSCVSLLVSQWVEAKKEAIAMQPELAGELSRRTLMEVLSQHSFPREVRAVYLQEELRTCKTLSPAATAHSFQLAVVEAQLQLYGEEWGCEGGMVGRARATTELAALRRVLREDRESSPLELLDEALSLLEPLVSAPNHTPQHLLCQAREQLALTHVWRAISSQEQLMGSCDLTPPTSLPAANEGGHPAKPDEQEQDQENERDRLLCLSPAQEEAMLCEDAAECLLLATQAWEGLWGTLRERGSGKCQAHECFYDRPSTFQWLHLTSSLCLAHRKPLLTLRNLGVLIEIFHWAPLPELLAPYQQALAQYCELALEVGVSEEHRARLESVLAGTTPSEPSLRGRGLLELEGSHLSCHLALARSKLERGMPEDCRCLLVGVFQSPLLSRHNALAYHLTARAKAATARYLQHSPWTLRPGNEFLQYLLREPCQPLETGILQLTPLELCADATRLCRGLASSNNVPVSLPTLSHGGADDRSHPSPPSLSPQATSWQVLCELFRSLLSLARVYLLQGGVREAYCYAREGLQLARSLLLHGWYVEFLLLLAEVQRTRGELSSSGAVLQQAARLTDLHSYLSAASAPSPRGRSSLPLHPAACLCSSCSNPVCLLQSVSTLQLWVELQLEGAGQGDDHAKRWLQILSESSKLANACRKKCNRALEALPPLEALGGKQPSECGTRSKNRGRRRKGNSKKPSNASAGDSPLCLDRSPAWTCLLLRSSALEAETLAALDDFPGSLASVGGALSGLQSGVAAATAAPEYRSALARLYCTAGVATLHEEESRDPSSSEELWENSRDDQAGGLAPTLLSAIPEGVSAALEHFLASYQLCYPTSPAHLLRDTCHWLCVCLSRYHSGLAFHFLTLGTQLTLGHQAVYALGKRIRNSPSPDSMQQLPFQDVLDTLSPAPPRPPTPHHSPTLAARNTLTPPPTPPPLSHTHHLLNSLPENWTVCSLSLAPRMAGLRGFPSDRLEDTRDHLLVARARRGEGPRVVKVAVADGSAVRDLGDILSASGASMTLTDKRSWWSTRRQLDQLIKELLNQLETSWLGSWKFLLEPATDAMATGGSSQDSPIILLLGQRVQALPWEATPTLARSSVGRMPSLGFTVAHRHLLGHGGSVLADPRKAFYVLNPRGDLPNTEKVFAGWFTNEQGWRGVVGRSPTSEEFTVALQNHSLFVYCGHGTGREYLSTDGFHQLCCQATTVLMGCSSGRLTGGGACDPGGVAFSYLMAGCPSLVANLWDVTDGDIDRFCKMLLKSWLRDPTLALSNCVSDSRSACRLQQLVGASPVLYGVPLAYSAK